ncbi:MAG: T9SS type A sorting domain-containing protein [Saprospiraceae bacterium]|nr:T9SS type A sorting domain-containing protein [Saprospiraceae bacterium]
MSVKLFIFCYILVFFGSESFCQKEDYIWLYGWEPFDIRRPDRAADTTRGSSNIDFNFDPPKIYYVPGRFIDFGDSNSSVCDSSGHLLAYTNGQVIYNGKDKPIADTINYSPDWEYWNLGNDTLAIPVGLAFFKSSLVLPVPGMQDEYYVFYQTVDRNTFHTVNTRYSRIMKNDSSNSWTVIYKDKLLIEEHLGGGAIAACRHANGRDWWFILPLFDTKTFQLYLISDDTIINKGKVEIGLDTEEFGIGTFVFSSNGEYFALMGGYRLGEQKILIKYGYFNRCTGSFTYLGEERHGSFGLLAAVAFSYNSRFLYIVDNNTKIYQYDLKSTNISESKLLVAEYDGYEYINPTDVNQFGYKVNFCYMGEGPDGRIYISPSSGSTRKMGVIEYPHERGEACEVRQHSIHIPTVFTRTMPNFPTYRLGPLDGSPCDTLGLDNHPVAKFRYEPDTLDHLRIRFTDLSYFRPETWSWDFGDGSPKVSDRYPFHRYTQNGTYNVCLTVSNENSSNTTCRTITIGTSNSDDTPEPSAIADITLYPNPVVDFLLVTLGEYVPEYGQIFLYDMTGRQVHTQRIWYGQNNVDMSRLSAGMYVGRITDKGRLIRKVKVVKGG